PQDDSLAKKAVAFFKISRSMRSRWFSARSRRSSSSTAGRCPLPGNACAPSSARACFQLRSMLSLRSRSRATSARLRPCSVMRRTASILNSRVNVRRCLAIADLLTSSLRSFLSAHHSWGSPLDHRALLDGLREKIHDGRFVRLIENLLKAGYLEDWKYGATHSGAPQGGIVSPILSNIYLDRLDRFVEQVLIPEYTRGAGRKTNEEYDRLRSAVRRLERTNPAAAAELREQLRRIPSVVLDDPDYRRLRYVRYADDFLLGFVGPREEAEEIKRRIGEFLRDQLKLELSETKTLITHARSGHARFL